MSAIADIVRRFIRAVIMGVPIWAIMTGIVTVVVMDIEGASFAIVLAFMVPRTALAFVATAAFIAYLTWLMDV